MAMIYRGDLSELEAFSNGDHGSIDDTEWKIEVVLHEFRHAARGPTLD
jgi:hypothetical protein